MEPLEVLVLDEGTPLFLQIAQRLAADIVEGSLVEGARVPSTNEFAAFYRINPATAAKGVSLLVDKRILYKRRGIGMFVATGARTRLLAERESTFTDNFVEPLLAEAAKLGLSVDTVVDLVRTRASRTPTT